METDLAPQQLAPHHAARCVIVYCRIYAPGDGLMAPDSADYEYGYVICPTYLELLVGRRRAGIWVWVVAGILGAIIPLVGYFRLHSQSMLGTFVLLGACIAILPLAMRGIYSIFGSWTRLLPNFLRKEGGNPSEYICWAKREFDRLNRSAIPRNFGVVYAVFALTAFWLGGAFDRLPIFTLLLCAIIALLSSFACGVGLAAVFFLGQSIWRLGREYPVRISEHGFGVLSVGRALVKAYALISIVWCCYTASGAWALRERWVPLVALAAPALLFFISSFVICQFPLHLRMVECKRLALVELDSVLEKLTPTSPEEMTQDRQQIDFCVGQIRRISHWPEWPFSLADFSSVLGVSVGAVAPQLIEIASMILKYRHTGSA